MLTVILSTIFISSIGLAIACIAQSIDTCFGLAKQSMTNARSAPQILFLRINCVSFPSQKQEEFFTDKPGIVWEEEWS